VVQDVVGEVREDFIREGVSVPRPGDFEADFEQRRRAAGNGDASEGPAPEAQTDGCGGKDLWSRITRATEQSPARDTEIEHRLILQRVAEDSEIVDRAPDGTGSQ